LVTLPFVGSEQEANLSPSHADITGGNVHVTTNVLTELHHKRAAKLPDLVIRFALWIEIGAAFATAHIHCVTDRGSAAMFGLALPELADAALNLRPVKAFLKICSNPRNFRIDMFTDGWKRSPPLYGPNAELNCTR
jgi:hypothetical protein